MAAIPIPLGPTSDKAKSRQGGGSVLVNCYVEETAGGKTPYSINADPRLKLFATVLSGGAGRGTLAVGNSLYVVCGEGLFKVASTGIATRLGTVLGQRPVVMSVNRKAPYVQITITADTKNYYVENDVLAEVTDADLPAGVHSNCYIKGRTVYGLRDGSYYWSGENATETIDALNFAEAERDSDEGVRVYAYDEYLWVFGSKSREVIQFTASTSEPELFTPLPGMAQGDGDGCSARHSPATVNGAVYWVNDYKTVVASTGGKAERVSNHEVDRDIEQAIRDGQGDDLTGFAYGAEGHQFYYLRGPSWCWVLDTSTGLWHRRESYLSDTFRCGFYVDAFSKSLLLDATDGKLYEYGFTTQDDAGEPFIMKVVTSPLNAFPDGYKCASLHVDMQSGVGDAESAAYIQEPEVMLRVSRDGGMTWGNEHRRTAGAQGRYSQAVRFNRLGHTNGRGMAFEISMSAPVQRALFQAVANVEPLRAG